MLSSILRPILLLAALLLAPVAATASPSLQFINEPGEVLPGETFTFDVVLLDALDLSSFNIELLLTGSGTAGSDYYFVSAVQAPLQYVFNPDDDNFLAAINTPITQDSLTLSDFLLAGSVNTLAGVNDRIAHITVATSASYTGPLAITVNLTSLELDNSDFLPIEDFEELSTNLPTAAITVTAIPEPTTAAALALLSSLLFVRRRKRLPQA